MALILRRKGKLFLSPIDITVDMEAMCFGTFLGYCWYPRRKSVKSLALLSWHFGSEGLKNELPERLKTLLLLFPFARGFFLSCFDPVSISMKAGCYCFVLKNIRKRKKIKNFLKLLTKLKTNLKFCAAVDWIDTRKKKIQYVQSCYALGAIHISRKHIFGPFWRPSPLSAIL